MGDAQVLAGVDIVALRLASDGGLQLLLLQRPVAPFAGQWALPGVLVNGRCADPSLHAAAGRALQEKAQVQPQYLEQVGTVGSAGRDPRGWSLATVYLALLAPSSDVAAPGLAFFALGALPALAFDHAELVQSALERLAGKAQYSSLPLHLLGPRFTVTEALLAFQACLGQPVQHTTLRGRLERMKQQGWVRETGEKNQPPMGRPQALLQHLPGPGGTFLFDRSVLV